ncbi:MAG: TonB-dependent receptor [Bacteroidaceae bacterium]|nr:TonB-dependent receptor [Bacteroidaceae bacterium]
MKQILYAAAIMLWPLTLSASTEKADSTLRDVVVTGTRAAVPERAIAATVTTITDAQLTQLERVSVLPTLTELVPNVFVTQRGLMGYGVSGGAAGGINVRGMNSGTGQVMVLVDGHPQYQGIFGHSIADAYQTMVAERVEIVRGPASLLYGSNAMGGVVNIITKGHEREGVRTAINVGAGSYNSLQADAHNSVRAGRFFSEVGANYQGSDNHRDDMGFYQYGGFAKLGFDVTSHWTLWASANVTHFAANNPGPVSAPLLDARQWINRGVVEAAAENHYARTSGAINVYHNFGRHKINDGHTAAATPRDFLFRSEDALTGVSLHQGFSLWQDSWITLGFDYQNIHGECWNADIHTNERLNRKMEQNMHYPLQKDLTELAGYVDVRQDITSWWTVQAGVRYDHHSEAGGEWVPQGGFVFRPVRTGELKLTAGKGFRVPNLKEMYLYGVANPDLKPERLWNYEAAWKQRLVDGRLTYGVNVFYLKADNLIGTTMVESLGRAANYNTGRTEHYGAELEAAYQVNGHWALSTNHSYLHTEKPLLAAPEYKGYLGAQYRAGKFDLNAGLLYVGGLCTNVETESKEAFPMLNVGVAYHLLPQLKLWARGENLLAQKYEINEGFPMPKATVMAGLHVEF